LFREGRTSKLSGKSGFGSGDSPSEAQLLIPKRLLILSMDVLNKLDATSSDESVGDDGQRLHLPILTFAWLSVRQHWSKKEARIRKAKLNIFVFRKD
jgi:hypothetical protein